MLELRRILSPRKDSITRASVVKLFSTLVSRVLGFVRQMLIASYFGASAETDAFFVATVLPKLFTSVVSAVPTVFVPVFVQEREAKGEWAAWSSARKISGAVLLYLFFALVLGVFLTPHVVRALAPGFDVRRYNLTVVMSYALLPVLLFQGMYGAVQSIFNVNLVFSFPTVASLMINVILILFILLFRSHAVVSLAIGTVVAYGSYVTLLTIVAKRKWPQLGFEYRLKDPVLSKSLRLLLPLYFGSSLSYLNLFIDRIFASTLPEGAVSSLNYAVVVKELPISLFAGSLTQVIYPTAATHVAQGRYDNLRSLILRSLEAIWLFVIPATVALLLMPEQTVRVVYERGVFNAEATKRTAEALFFYTLGGVANASVGVVLRVYYSLNDTKTPVKVSAIGLILNVALNALLLTYSPH